MIRIAQQGAYDCMTACLASIFELPYDEAPHLCSPETGAKIDGGWWNAYETWLGRRGWAVISRVRTEGDGEPMWCPWSLNSYWIGGVKSPRTDGDHAVVMHGNQIVWDPHPRRDEKLHEGFTSCDYFVPLDPARFALRP